MLGVLAVGAAAAGAAGAWLLRRAVVALRSLRLPTASCVICLSTFPRRTLVCATATPDCTGVTGCGHYYCTACLRAYLASMLRERRFPERCPFVGRQGLPCPGLLPPLTVQELLESLDSGAQMVGGGRGC